MLDGMEPLDDVSLRSLDDLARDVAAASTLRHSVNLVQLEAELPGLLVELRAAVYTLTGSDRERASGCWLRLMPLPAVAYKLGYIDLASLTVERYEWAAGQSGDELAVLVGDYQRAGEMIGTADWSSALRLRIRRLVRDSELETQPSRSRDPHSRCVSRAWDGSPPQR